MLDSAHDFMMTFPIGVLPVNPSLRTRGVVLDGLAADAS
jgi:hypothetical protein